MKLKFKKQEFQNDAVKSVTDLFKGQPQRTSSFSLRSEQGQLTLMILVMVINYCSCKARQKKQNYQNVVMRIGLADLRKRKEIKQAQETLKNKENNLYDTLHESKFVEDTEINGIKGIATYKRNIHRHILY